MTAHPFEKVSLRRLSQAHPKFWTRINMASVRAEIERGKLSGTQENNTTEMTR